MSSKHYKMEELKLKLKSVRKIKLRNERSEFNLRSEELVLTEEVSLIKFETESMLQQLEDVKREISQMKYQNTMIDICSESEKSKVESHTMTINNHKNAFEDLFTKERDAVEFQNMELRAKQAENDELQRQRYQKNLEINEQKAKEVATVDEEYEVLERECNILRKRNKAIMLILRRKLIEAEETRRNLMKKKN